jgi:hypothetical protein
MQHFVVSIVDPPSPQLLRVNTRVTRVDHRSDDKVRALAPHRIPMDRHANRHHITTDQAARIATAPDTDRQRKPQPLRTGPRTGDPSNPSEETADRSVTQW